MALILVFCVTHWCSLVSIFETVDGFVLRIRLFDSCSTLVA